MAKIEAKEIVPHELLLSMQMIININREILGEKYKSTDLYILTEIYRHPGVTSKQIMKDMGYTKGYVSQIIRRLEGLGLIYRLVNERDRKSFGVYTTKKGETVTEAYLEQTNMETDRLAEQLMKEFRPEDIETFQRIGREAGEYYLELTDTLRKQKR